MRKLNSEGTEDLGSPRFNALECADLSALWSDAKCYGPYCLNAPQQRGVGPRQGQSGDRSPHSKELTPTPTLKIRTTYTESEFNYFVLSCLPKGQAKA